MQEMTELFDINAVSSSCAIFDMQKLDWLNGEHIKRLSTAELGERLAPFLARAGLTSEKSLLAKVIEVQKERLRTLGEFVELSGFFFELPKYAASLLRWQTSTTEETKTALNEAAAALGNLPDAAEWNEEKIRSALEALAAVRGKGNIYWPLRVALSGQSASPDPVILSTTLGKHETIRRIDVAIIKLNEA